MHKNKVFIVGHLGRDPEIKNSVQGGEFAILSVATNSFSKNKKDSKVEWHNVVVFIPHFVDLIKNYASKGDLVYIEGSLSTTIWKDDYGKEKSRTQIVVKSLQDDFQISNTVNLR